MQKIQEKLLTIQEVANKLRVDETTVRRWIKQGILKAILLPYRGIKMKYRIKQSVLDNILG
jgi:excisionase family DNA binding protein